MAQAVSLIASLPCGVRAVPGGWSRGDHPPGGRLEAEVESTGREAAGTENEPHRPVGVGEGEVRPLAGGAFRDAADEVGAPVVVHRDRRAAAVGPRVLDAPLVVLVVVTRAGVRDLAG